MAQDDNDQAQGGGENAEQGGQGALDVQSTVDYALELIQDQARTHPMRTLGVAAGIGYVLGGGVPKILVRLGLLFAGRLVTDAIATEGLRSLSGNLMGDQDEGGTEQASAQQPRSKNGHHRKRGQGERQARRE
jgi:hypothetical protein